MFKLRKKERTNAMCVTQDQYGVATISRLLKIVGLFCKRALSKRLYSAKETWTVKEPTNRSHPIPVPKKRDTYDATKC